LGDGVGLKQARVTLEMVRFVEAVVSGRVV
jgi:hypothetical protein